MENEIERCRKSIKEYRKAYGQSQLSTDCIIQLMMSHARNEKELTLNKKNIVDPQTGLHY